MENIPNERSLVARLKNEPFALVGISNDQAEDATKEDFARRGVTWRNFRETRENNVISKAWRIQLFPAFFVIDAVGRIRWKCQGSPGTAGFSECFDGTIDALIEETRAASSETSKPPRKP